LVPKIKAALIETGIDLTEVIRSSLMTKEILKPADEQYSRSATPVGVPRNAPIVCAVNLGWAIANLAAAWTKLNLDSKY